MLALGFLALAVAVAPRPLVFRGVLPVLSSPSVSLLASLAVAAAADLRGRPGVRLAVPVEVAGTSSPDEADAEVVAAALGESADFFDRTRADVRAGVEGVVDFLWCAE